MITRDRLIILVATLTLVPQTAQGQECSRHGCVDWRQLNLNSQQDDKIRRLQTDWDHKYSQLMPQIRRQQEHLQELFRNPHADPLEIVSTQQTIMRLQEQLRNEAMANYLHKRSVLNDLQQRQMQAQLHQMVVERQQRPADQEIVPAQESDSMSQLMQWVRWAFGPH